MSLGRAVNLIRQYQLGENRATQEHQLTTPLGVLLDHIRAGDVRRHQVGRELHPAEREAHGLGKTFDGIGFRQAWHSFQQAMAAGEDGDEELLNHLVLTHNRLTHFRSHLAIDRRDFARELFVAGAGKCFRSSRLTGRGLGTHRRHHQQGVASRAFDLGPRGSILHR